MNVYFDDRRCQERKAELMLEDRYEAWERLITLILQKEQAPQSSEIAVSIVDDEEIKELNATYRNNPSVTDVLSFPCDEADDYEELDDEPILLGDIIIAPVFSSKRAIEYENTPENELCLLLAHGTLHLLGYDHIEDEEAEVMEAKEDAYLEFFFKSEK